MANVDLIFKFEGEEKDYIFKNKVVIVSDEKLVNNLEKPNIKNEDSSLIIKSMNNTPIYDVIQLKINMSETGTFLVSFAKDQLDEEKRTKLIEEIKTLKTKNEPDSTTQLEKAFSLIKILNKYQPIYVTFKNSGEIKLDIDKLTQVSVKFPLLLLKKEPKTNRIIILKEKLAKFTAKFKKEKPEKVVENKKTTNTEKVKKEEKPKEPRITFKLLTVDYVFVLLFAMLFSFGVQTAFFEIDNTISTAIFLFVISFILFITLEYCCYSTLYKRLKIRHKNLHSYMLLFVCLGSILGLVLSFVISKFALKLECEINYLYFIAVAISFVFSIISIPLTFLINKVMIKIKK